MSDFDFGLPLPPDLSRLRTIRAWLEQQQAQHEVIATYLSLAIQHVDAAITAATPSGFRLQRHRLTGQTLLHRADCWIIRTGPELSREEALSTWRDTASAVLCDVCRPDLENPLP